MREYTEVGCGRLKRGASILSMKKVIVRTSIKPYSKLTQGKRMPSQYKAVR